MRVRRGGEHLDELKAAIRRYRDSGPVRYTEHLEVDDHGPWTVVRWADVKAPKPELGLIAGDALHSLRCALDHLMGAIYYSRGWRGPSTPLFPLLTRPITRQTDRHKWNKAVAPLSQPQQALLTEVQPYRDPADLRNVRLGLLQALDNLDKHELVAPILMTATHIEGRPPHASDEWGQPLRFRYVSGPVTEGAEVFRYGATPDARVKVEVYPGVKVGFGDARVNAAEITDIKGVVIDTIERFVALM